jgi:type II secretory pathway pseudopilin PulG
MVPFSRAPSKRRDDVTNLAASGFKAFRGGTLIEVLVSLVIVTLIASSVLEVASHRRRVVADGRRVQTAFDLALLWQAGRSQGEKWSMGDAGGFPGQDDMRWVLEPLPVPTSEGSRAPDDLWRRLQVIHLDVGREEVSSFVFRLDRPAVAAAEAP